MVTFMTERTLEWLQRKIRNYTDQNDKNTAYKFLDTYRDIEGVNYDELHLQILTSTPQKPIPRKRVKKRKQEVKTKTKEYKTSKATTTIRERR